MGFPLAKPLGVRRHAALSGQRRSEVSDRGDPRPASTTCRCCWTVLVATFMWAFAGHEDPTPGDIGVMVVLIVLPLTAVLPIAALIQRRRLRPVLAAAPLTTERIPYAELQKKVRASTPLKQSLNALVASLFAFFSASLAVLTHLLTRHVVLDSYVALWGFVAIAFGFASFLWYRQVLGKAKVLESARQES
jgi:hypothetical protein